MGHALIPVPIPEKLPKMPRNWNRGYFGIRIYTALAPIAGVASSVDFARPRLNFTGNCPNWHRRLASSSALFPLRLSSKSMAALNVCIGWIWFGSRHASIDFSADPPSDNDSAIRRSNALPLLFLLRSCDQVQSNRPLALPPRHDSDRRRHNLPPRGMERNLQTSRRGSRL